MSESQPGKKPKKKKPSLREMVTAPPPRPSLDAFLDHFFAHAGGPAKLAKALYDEFTAALPGTQIRSRVLETILRGLKASDQANGKPLDDMSVLADQDLERLLVERERRMAEHLEPTNAADPGRPGDAQPAPAPPGPGEAPAGGGPAPGAAAPAA